MSAASDARRAGAKTSERNLALVDFGLQLEQAGEWPETNVWPTFTKRFNTSVRPKTYRFATYRNARSLYTKTRDRLEADALSEYRHACKKWGVGHFVRMKSLRMDHDR